MSSRLAVAGTECGPWRYTVPFHAANDPKPNATYWEQATKGLNFTDADRIDGALFNRILWQGLMGNKPYPAAPTGKDLRQNHGKLLADY